MGPWQISWCMILNLSTFQESRKRGEEINRQREKLSCARRQCAELDRCLRSGVIEWQLPDTASLPHKNRQISHNFSLFQARSGQAAWQVFPTAPAAAQAAAAMVMMKELCELMGPSTHPPPHFKDPLLNAVIWPGYIILSVNVVLVTSVVMPCHHTKAPRSWQLAPWKARLNGGTSVPVLFKYCFNYCKNPVLFVLFFF